MNGSTQSGARMVREFSKLMLRAYNNEADNAVRSMKPYTLESSVARLDKARETITKLGGTMHSDDAVSLETSLHHELANRRVNLVNLRREFFRATPAEAGAILARHEASIIHWTDEPEAAEWRQSETTHRHQDSQAGGND
jgi:Domain of unknown function (DUF4041)/Meiotically up-regulated gene 113